MLVFSNKRMVVGVTAKSFMKMENASKRRKYVMKKEIHLKLQNKLGKQEKRLYKNIMLKKLCSLSRSLLREKESVRCMKSIVKQEEMTGHTPQL